jgi:hypothetical protein
LIQGEGKQVRFPQQVGLATDRNHDITSQNPCLLGPIVRCELAEVLDLEGQARCRQHALGSLLGRKLL